MPVQKRRLPIIAVVGIGLVIGSVAGYGVWDFGQERSWWGQSRQVQRLWDEPLIRDVETSYGDVILQRISAETRVGKKPTPPSVALIFDQEVGAKNLVDFIKMAAQKYEWRDVGTCPGEILYCAIKSTTPDETWVLTYEEGIGERAQNRKVEGKLTISVQ